MSPFLRIECTRVDKPLKLYLLYLLILIIDILLHPDYYIEPTCSVIVDDIYEPTCAPVVDWLDEEYVGPCMETVKDDYVDPTCNTYIVPAFDHVKDECLVPHCGAEFFGGLDDWMHQDPSLPQKWRYFIVKNSLAGAQSKRTSWSAALDFKYYFCCAYVADDFKMIENAFSEGGNKVIFHNVPRDLIVCEVTKQCDLEGVKMDFLGRSLEFLEAHNQNKHIPEGEEIANSFRSIFFFVITARLTQLTNIYSLTQHL